LKNKLNDDIETGEYEDDGEDFKADLSSKDIMTTPTIFNRKFKITQLLLVDSFVDKFFESIENKNEYTLFETDKISITSQNDDNKYISAIPVTYNE